MRCVTAAATVAAVLLQAPAAHGFLCGGLGLPAFGGKFKGPASLTTLTRTKVRMTAGIDSGGGGGGGGSGGKSHETDVVVIGSGIGGLSAAAIAARHGNGVTVLESHYEPGGVAHSFDRGGYSPKPYPGVEFDAGPSLWNGMSQPSTNPLRQVLDALGEEIEWIQYDGWGMHVPEGYFRFEVGPPEDSFEGVLRRLGGEADVNAWRELTTKMRPLLKASAAIPPLALRGDRWAALTLAPYLAKALLSAGLGVQALQGAFTDVLEGTVPKGTFLYRWLDYLSFALSGLPADGTMAAAVIYTLGDMHRPGSVLDYPCGGAGAVIQAMIRGIDKLGGRVMLRSHVEEVLVEGGKAVGVRLRDGSVVRARRAVVSNASIWDTMRLLPAGSVPEEYVKASMATPDTGSFMHLHLGIDATGLEGLDIHYSVVEDWGKPIDAPQNMFIVSIPTVLDPTLAPEGKHLVHIYTAGNEPYSVWEGLRRGSPEYEALKKERGECLWKALERIIPDIRARTELELVASPLTHEYYARRHKGSYGPGWQAGKDNFPGCVTPLPGLLHCGDSTLPGLGLPAVAASGMNAASTLTPVWRQLSLLWEMKRKGFMRSQFDDF